MENRTEPPRRRPAGVRSGLIIPVVGCAMIILILLLIMRTLNRGKDRISAAAISQEKVFP